jgi:hypothetical protein
MGLRIGEPPMESFVGSLVREGFLRPGASITERVARCLDASWI